MYLARFSYDVLPINRQRAIDLIRREVEAARQTGLTARLLVPLTRNHGGAALQFEVELSSLDQLDQFRQRGVGSGDGDRQLDAVLQRDPCFTAGSRDPARGRSAGIMIEQRERTAFDAQQTLPRIGEASWFFAGNRPRHVLDAFETS